jgi:hypothetical protein
VNGRKNPTPGINCCVSSEPRGISMIPQLTWGSLRGGIAVELYTQGTATIDGVRVESKTDFPNTGKVVLTLRPAAEKRFPVFLRVPQWTARFSAKAGGQSFAGKAGEYVTIDRAWKPGEHIEIDMDITTRVLDGGKSYPGQIALQRGPQVLALDLSKNPSLPSLHAVAIRETPRSLPQAPYIIDAVVASNASKSTQRLTMIPFMDAQTYRVWLPKESGLRTGEIAVSLFGTESSSRSVKNQGSICDGRPETYRTTNSGAPKAEDWFAVRFDRAETIRRVVYRHGKSEAAGGWFAEKPRIEIMRANSKTWEAVGTLADYPADGRALADGQAFTVQLSTPVEAVAVRVAGKPSRYVSCAELEAFR